MHLCTILCEINEIVYNQNIQIQKKKLINRNTVNEN